MSVEYALNVLRDQRASILSIDTQELEEKHGKENVKKFLFTCSDKIKSLEDAIKLLEDYMEFMAHREE